MPYNQEPMRIGANYLAGQQGALNVKRNKLAIEDEERYNKLAADPNTTPDQFARAGRTDIANSLAGAKNRQDQLSADQRKQFAELMVNAAKYGLNSPTPKAFIEQNYPQLAQLAGDKWAALDDAGVKAKLQEAIGIFGPQAGIGPEPAPRQFERMEGPRGSILQRDPLTNELRQVVGPDNSQPAPTATKRFRAMSPQEIQASGLPAGTAAQVNDETGQIQVLSRRDATANLTQKDAAVVKQKLTTLNLARQQLQNIQQRFNEIKGSFVAGAGGQGKLPTPKGQAFDRSVDQMRSTLSALTRVPGIGAMSDFETKLDQAKFPNRGDYENVTQQQIDDIGMMLRTLDEGYRGLIDGTAPPSQDNEPDLSSLSDEDLLRALAGG